MALASIHLEPSRGQAEPALDGARRAELMECFVGRDVAALSTLLATLSGPLARLRIDVVDNARAAEAAPVWRVDPDGTHRFRFHEKTWTRPPHIIFARWLDTLPFIAAMQPAKPVGSCVLNLGDEGHRLSRCAHA